MPARGTLLIEKADAFLRALSYVVNEYRPIKAEIRTDVPGVLGPTSWAHMHAYRFARAIALTESHARQGGTLVDLGAYPGTLLRLLKESLGYQDLRGVGLSFDEEFSRAMSDAGIGLFPCNIDPAVTFSEEERRIPSRIPLSDSSASIVYFMETIEHVYNVENVLSELRRIVKPGGLVYCTTNNISHLPGLLRLFRGRSNLDVDLKATSLLSSHQWRGHVRFYSLKELNYLFESHGFRTLAANYVEPYFMFGSPGFDRGIPYRAAKAALHRWGGRYRSHVEVLCERT
jgi:SAM-dependent methyltransferase